MRHKLYSTLLASIGLLITGCDDITYAPVEEISTIQRIPSSGTHRVSRGETLYEIAWRYGLDYRSIANINHMQAPYQMYSGQVIRLRANAYQPIPSTRTRVRLSNENRKIKHFASTVTLTSSAPQNEPTQAVASWIWPANGKIIRSFSSINKGINIAGHKGDPIYAAAAGKVVYSGAGLRGYGNLIIIKHNSVFLSAYAHNRVVVVKEGMWVRQGQKIAEMGSTGSDNVMLHFEIRRAGKPINPVSLYQTS